MAVSAGGIAELSDSAVGWRAGSVGVPSRAAGAGGIGSASGAAAGPGRGASAARWAHRGRGRLCGARVDGECNDQCQRIHRLVAVPCFDLAHRLAPFGIAHSEPTGRPSSPLFDVDDEHPRALVRARQAHPRRSRASPGEELPAVFAGWRRVILDVHRFFVRLCGGEAGQEERGRGRGSNDAGGGTHLAGYNRTLL